jgi:diguanylate cyclase (GGDEF)-like protein
MAIRVAQTSLAALSTASANEPAPLGDGPPTPPLRTVDGAGGRSGPGRALLEILRFVVEGADADAVADRAVASLGLLPDVAWAELDGDAAPAPGRIFATLGDPAGPGGAGVHRLCVQLTDPSDLQTVGTIETLLGLIATVASRQCEVTRLRGEAHADALTGLFNRRGLEPFVEQALARAQRTGEEIAVLLCDVDHFKRINDAHGHEAGDRALVAVAEAIESVIRPSDLAARLGGDELVILLAGSNAVGATVVAERLRRALASAGAPVVGAEAPTLSIGIADTRVLDDGERTGPRAREALLRAADRALYCAKSAGRDRWACHSACSAPTELLEDRSTSRIELLPASLAAAG